MNELNSMCPDNPAMTGGYLPEPEPPQPVAGHTLDWKIDGQTVIQELPGVAIVGMAVFPICRVANKRHRELIASAPRLVRENAALREAAKKALSYIQRKHGTSNHDTSCAGCAACDGLKTALALSGSVLTPKPPSNAATGQPEGKKGAI